MIVALESLVVLVLLLVALRVPVLPLTALVVLQSLVVLVMLLVAV